MTLLSGHTALAERAASLWSYLSHNAELWRTRPFTDPSPPWVQRLDGLAGWLDGLTHAQIDMVDAGTMPPGEVHPELLKLRVQSAELCEVPQLPIGDGEPAGQWRVPGRKLAQIVAFSHACREDAQQCDRVVEWCAGKGHLGRMLGQEHQVPVELLELNGSLGPSAVELAHRAAIVLNFTEVDVRGPLVDRLQVRDLVVGLHACGELGMKMLEDCVAANVAAFALAPCCYHRVSDPAAKLQPRSATLAGLGVAYEHTMLRLATADDVVAPSRLRRRRIHGNGFRLGLDNLLREASGRDVYTPLGTSSPDELADGFEAFCHRVAARLGLALPATWSPDESEAAGHERARLARARGMVRAQFRRPLELLVVIDRALALAEAGLDVDVVRFCRREVTPRNLLIRARRRG